MAIEVPITLGLEYYPNPLVGRPLFNSNVYVGIQDLDPEIEANRITITVIQEDGTRVPILPAAQPLLTGSGGVILYLGSPVSVVTDVAFYSIKVTDQLGSQVYYVPSVGTAIGTALPNYNQFSYASVADMVAADIQVSGSERVGVSTSSYYGGWAALSNRPIGGTDYDIVTLAEFTSITGIVAPDELGDHTLTNTNVAMRRNRAIASVTEFGAKGDDTTEDQVAGQAAQDSLTGGGDLHFPNTGSSYLMKADTVALETQWLNLAAGLTTHTAIEMTNSNVRITAEEGAEVRLLSTKVASQVSYVFANKQANALSGISYFGLKIDLDTDGNAGAAQARGILGVSITDLYFDRSLELYSSNTKGGYATEAYNCFNVESNMYAHNVSGGLNMIYSENIKTDIQIDKFNECVDLDKVNKNAMIRVVCKNGGECVDSNATIGGKYDIVAKDCGRIFNSTPKGPFAANWADHIADINKVHNNETDIDINFVAENCAYSKTTPSIVIGHSWADSTHPNVNPVSRVKISGVASKIGQIFVKEAKDITFHDLLIDDILGPATGATEGCLNLKSEGDWTTYPDAQAWSDLSVTFDNVKIRNANRFGIHIDYPSTVVIRNTETDTTSTEPGSVDAGVKITHIAERNGYIDIDGLKCSNGYDGLAINADTGATSEIHLQNLNLSEGNSNIDFRLLDGEEYIYARREYMKFGTIAAGSADDYPLLRMRRAGKLLNAVLINASDIPQSDADFTTYTLFRRDASGAGAAQIANATTELTGGLTINGWSPISIGQAAIVADPQSVFAAGQVLSLSKADTGTGQATDNLMMEIEYIEF